VRQPHKSNQSNPPQISGESDAAEACQLLPDQRELLRQIIHDATEPSDKNIVKPELANFLLHHSLHVYEMAKSGLLLMEKREPYAVVLIGRSALESMFNLAAASQDREFGPQRIALEFEQLAKKLSLLIDKNVWPATRRPTPTEYLDEAARIRRTYSAPKPSQPRDRERVQNIERIAEVAGLSPYYDDDYRLLSLTVHGNQAGILNAGSGFLVRKGMLALSNATFLASLFLSRAHRLKAHDELLENHKNRLEMLMKRPDVLSRPEDFFGVQNTP
jgi:hypothetical protein